MPKGYLLVEIAVTNQEGFEKYRAMVRPTVAKFGGRALVRGGNPKLVEGDRPAKGFVVLEFDSVERAMEWYNSPEYQSILPLRTENSIGRAFFLTGV
jgi:uncharacterized protein (DUF1330 family)